MSNSSIDSLKIKAKLLQKAKKKTDEAFTLKEAYHLIAKAAGYSSWKEMKDAYETADILNPPRWSALWKIWFASREEALQHMKDGSTYLLPYLKQFFICDVNYLNALGISQTDQDLLKVGNDWTHPRDKESWNRLFDKIKKGPAQ